MSIIVEALKKAQGPLKQAARSTVKDAVSLPPSVAEKSKPKTKKHIGVWIFALFLLIGGLSFHFLRPPSPSGGSALLKNEPGALKETAALREEIIESANTNVSEVEPRSIPESVEASTPTPTPAPIPAAPSPRPSSPALTLAMVSEAIDLDGIMYIPGRPRAIINGAIRREGDRIGKFTLSKIEANLVRITSKGQDFIIRLRH
jgi:hypothetical protein